MCVCVCVCVCVYMYMYLEVGGKSLAFPREEGYKYPAW